MKRLVHALSVDVEDWNNLLLLVELGRVVPPTSAVVRNTARLLDLFQGHGVNATWFVLGEVAAAFPELVQRLAAAGQEIGVHGYHHHKVFEVTEDEFRTSTHRAKDVIEQCAGRPVLGYRASAFSITKQEWWAFDVLGELGFRYDSSIFPIRGGRYGVPDAPLGPHTIATRHGLLHEVPLSVMEFGRLRLPCCGGGYLRHFPLWYTRLAMRHLMRHGRRAVYYLHPYEVDTGFDAAYFAQQSVRFDGIKLRWCRYLQYRNRSRSIPKLKWLLGRFAFDGIARVFGLN